MVICDALRRWFTFISKASERFDVQQGRGYHPLKMIRTLLALAQTSGIDSLDPPISKPRSLDIHRFPHAPGGILRILLRRQCFALLYGIVGHRGDLSEFISGTSLLKTPLLLGQPIQPEIEKQILLSSPTGIISRQGPPAPVLKLLLSGGLRSATD